MLGCSRKSLNNRIIDKSENRKMLNDCQFAIMLFIQIERMAQQFETDLDYVLQIKIFVKFCKLAAN